MISSLREQLVRDEGVRLHPYRDSVGKLTIGIGRNLDDVGISRAEAEILLENDIENATSRLLEALPWTEGLDAVRFSALVNMTFNMGIGGLLSFKNTLAAIREGDYKLARDHMLVSKWADQVGSRAARLAIQIDTGTWQ